MKKTLSEKTIEEITQKLSLFLANTFVLYVKTLNFHWNMKGPQFFMHHRLLQEQYEEMATAIDDLAERIRMLGRTVDGSMEGFLKIATLKESQPSLPMEEMIEILVEDHKALVEECHQLIRFADTVYDQGTSDLIVERIRAHSKNAWLLESHL